tara:strand:- start:4018 stop:4233 length:216 start_codon:yes stop_codon:yes gene_type:complete
MKDLMTFILIFITTNLFAISPVKIIEKGKIMSEFKSKGIVIYHIIYKDDYYVCTAHHSKVYCDKPEKEEVE